MKLFFKLICTSAAIGALSTAFAQSGSVDNISDSLDDNLTPASEETRAKVEKPNNLSDSKDRNVIPAPFETRQKQEEVRTLQDKSSTKTGSGTGTSTTSDQAQQGMDKSKTSTGTGTSIPTDSQPIQTPSAYEDSEESSDVSF